MRKILSLFTLFSVFLLVIGLSPGIEINASTTWNNDYVFDAVSTTSNGISITIDEGTNVFTLNGTATGSDYYVFPDILTPNSNGSVIDISKTYYVYYEYISGTVTGTVGSVIAFAALDVNENGNRYITLSSYENTAANQPTYDTNTGFFFSFIGIPPQFSMRGGLHNGVSATVVNQLKYRLTIKEIDPEVRTMDMFSDLTTTGLNGVSISFPSVNQFNINGNINSASTIIDLINKVDESIFENTKPMLIYFKKLGGTTNDSGGLIINGKTGNTTQMYKTEYGSLGVIVDEVLNMKFKANLYTKYYTNLTFEVFVQEIDIDEIPTPPTGISLYSSFYDGLIYYNTPEDLPAGQYYISTTTGSTFDFSILTEEQLIFNLDEGVTFKVNYGEDLYHEYTGPGDIVISEIGSSIKVRHIVNLQEVDSYTYDSTNPAEAISSLVVVTAIEPITEVEVSFFDEDGMTLLDSGTYEPGDLLIKPTDPVKEGFIFVGWEDSEGTMWNFETNTVGTELLDLFAVYVAEATPQYTVTFNSNGGSTVNSSLVYEGTNLLDVLSEITTTRSGFTFDHWYKNAGLTFPVTESDVVTADITLYAGWIESVVNYTVTFNINGGSYIAPLIVQSGSTVTQPTDPQKVGYIFDGWYEDIIFLNAYDFEDTVEGNITLYAKWILAEEQLEEDDDAWDMFVENLPWIILGVLFLAIIFKK